MEEPVTVKVPLQSKLLCNITLCGCGVVIVIMVVMVGGYEGDDDGENDEEEDSLSRWMSAPASSW